MAKPKFVTPKGVVKFPNVATPDKKGKYRIALVFDPKDEDFKKLIASIEKEENNFDKKFRGKPHYKKNYEIVDGEKTETGHVLMNFNSSFALFDDKDSKIFDAKGNKIKEDVGWGSVCKVAFTLSPYEADGNCGVTRYLSGIQVIEMKESGASAEGCGFKQEEGYVKQDNQEMTPEERQKAIDDDKIAWDE